MIDWQVTSGHMKSDIHFGSHAVLRRHDLCDLQSCKKTNKQKNNQPCLIPSILPIITITQMAYTLTL